MWFKWGNKGRMQNFIGKSLVKQQIVKQRQGYENDIQIIPSMIFCDDKLWMKCLGTVSS
jgi:hypothetical protein